MKLLKSLIYGIVAGYPRVCNDFEILPNPRADQNGYRSFTKYVNVLDCWSIYAEEGVSDEKVINYINNYQSFFHFNR